ncbi:MAG: nucleoside monophosphate kinase [Buchnera aphidicola (Nurudea yanoniella)]
MRILLIGAPGSGKGTQSKLISKKYHILNISIGEILRESIKEKTELGKKIKSFVDNGKLISDEIIINLVKNRISQIDCKSGFVLDGFPRTIIQAKTICKKEIIVDYIFELKIPIEMTINRILKRKTKFFTSKSINHENDKKIYLKKHKNLMYRKDDSEEIIKIRLQEYKKFTQSLTTYLISNLKEKKIKFYEIDGTQSILNVKKNIKKFLKIENFP